VVKPWHRLPREVVETPFPETFTVGLDGALSNLIRVKTSLLMAGGWDRWALKVPSHPNYSVIL